MTSDSIAASFRRLATTVSDARALMAETVALLQRERTR